MAIVVNKLMWILISMGDGPNLAFYAYAIPFPLTMSGGISAIQTRQVTSPIDGHEWSHPSYEKKYVLSFNRRTSKDP
jgi:hypothetical protein